jgi:hypothetical protein
MMGMEDTHDQPAGMSDPRAHLEALRRDLDVAERTAAELRVRIAAVEAAIVASTSSPTAATAEPARAANATRLRLLGDGHTSHRDGAELIVTDNEVLASHAPDAVTLRHARTLVARGKAEWIVPPP